MITGIHMDIDVCTSVHASVEMCVTFRPLYQRQICRKMSLPRLPELRHYVACHSLQGASGSGSAVAGLSPAVLVVILAPVSAWFASGLSSAVLFVISAPVSA